MSDFVANELSALSYAEKRNLFNKNRLGKMLSRLPDTLVCK